MKTLLILGVVALLVGLRYFKSNGSVLPRASSKFLETGLLLFSDRAEEYKAYIDLFRNNQDSFLEQYEEKLDEYGFDNLTEFDAFRTFGDMYGYLMYMDWRGEENEREVEDFVEMKLAGKVIPWFKTDALREENAGKEQADGKFIIKLYKTIDEDLREQGHALLFLAVDGDGYSFMVATLDELEKAKELSPVHILTASELR